VKKEQWHGWQDDRYDQVEFLKLFQIVQWIDLKEPHHYLK